LGTPRRPERSAFSVLSAARVVNPGAVTRRGQPWSRAAPRAPGSRARRRRLGRPWPRRVTINQLRPSSAART